MSSIRRCVSAIVATPVVMATLMLTPSAMAWGQGGNYTYSGGGNTQTLFSSSRNLTSYVIMNTQDSHCANYRADDKRNRTLQPTQTLMSTSQYSGCTVLETGQSFSLGQQTTFGNFSTPRSASRTVSFVVTGSGS